MTPKYFYFCGLYLLIFTILEIKTEKINYVLIKNNKYLLYVNINIFIKITIFFPKQKKSMRRLTLIYIFASL